MSKFTEERLEQAIVNLLGKEGYSHIVGEALVREPNDVLIKEDLKGFLSKRYLDEKITPGEIDSIVRKLEVLSSSDLYGSNKIIMDMVSNGFFLKRDNRAQKDLYVQLIDYSPENNNRYKIVTQLEITGYEKRIPDGILYINGLPLVVFEFKSAIREDATIFDAYVQLTTRYRRDIPELFKYNAICVISDGVNNKVGSFFAPLSFSMRGERSVVVNRLKKMESIHFTL